MRERLTFKQYLRKRPDSNDPAGDFVKDALQDRRLPRGGSWERLENYLYGRGACEGALDGAKEVWAEWMAGRR